LAIIAATSLYTAFHRMYEVWRLTGGEAAGWARPSAPFVMPAASEDENKSDYGQEEALE
jgi:hypothetical protein